MPSVEVEIEIYCDTCGDGLCNQSTGATTRNRGASSIRVEACKNCMKEAESKGYDEGYEAARKEYEKD